MEDPGGKRKSGHAFAASPPKRESWRPVLSPQNFSPPGVPRGRILRGGEIDPAKAFEFADRSHPEAPRRGEEHFE